MGTCRPLFSILPLLKGERERVNINKQGKRFLFIMLTHPTLQMQWQLSIENLSVLVLFN